MGMTRKAWSVNGLAVELCVDRRTIARRLETVIPAGSGPNGPLYWLSDCVRALHGGRAYRPTQEDDFDYGVTFFLQGFDEESEWEKLGEQLASVSDAALIVRRIRETLLARFWGNRRNSGAGDPACPEWRGIDDEAFDAAWTALVWDGATLAEVAAKLPAAARKKAAR